MKAHAAHLGIAIANTIISLLPIPGEIKKIFSLASSVSYLTFLLASGAPFIPIILAALAIFSALTNMGVGCNKGKNDNKPGNSKGNDGKGTGGGGGKQDKP